MRLNIPPVVPYAVGAMLVLFGSLRIKYLAAPRPAQSFGANGADDGVGDGPGESVRAGTEEAAPTERKPVRRKEQKRHLKIGGFVDLDGHVLAGVDLPRGTPGTPVVRIPVATTTYVVHPPGTLGRKRMPRLARNMNQR